MAGVWDDYYRFFAQDSTVHAADASSVISGGVNIFELAAGTQGPAQRALRPTAAAYENFPRVDAVSDLAALVTATETYVGIYLPKDFTVTTITFVTGGTAAVGPTHQLVGLRSSAKALLGSTADGTTTAIGANAAYVGTLATPYVTTVAGWFYATIATVVAGGGAAVPTLAGKATRAAVTGLAPTLAATANDTISTTLPSAGGTLTAVATVPYVYVA